MNSHKTDRHTSIARIVRICLADKGKRQAELAVVLGMDTGTMSRAMHGKRDWAIEDLERMAEFFDISVVTFFDDADSLLRGIRPGSDADFTGYLWADHPSLFDQHELAVA